MDTIEILRTASKLVYENVKDLAGTKEAVLEILEEAQVGIFPKI